MRGLRSFIVLLVIAVGLGAYVYFVESKRPADAGETRDKVFSGVEADKIEEIAIKSESGDRTTLKKSGSDWQIVQPMAAKPDPAEISGLTSNLSSLEVQRVIDEHPSDVAEYGLAQPRVDVTFKAGGQQHTLHIGRKTPPGTDLYARIDDQKRVFLISSYLDSTFNRGTFDLRDKTVLSLNRDAIDALTIAAPDRTLKVTKSGSDWRVAEPVNARADVSAIESLISRLSTLQMKSIAAPEMKSAAEFGLDKPAATVTIGTGSSQATLLVGTSAAEGTVYAKDASRPMVFTVDTSLLDDLKKDTAEFRQKDLFDARSFNATRLEIVRGDQTAAFEKTKTKDKDGKEEEKWRQVAPTARDVDASKMESLLSAVTQLRATGFADPKAKTGLDKPEMSITVKSDEGRRDEKVAIGRSGGDAYAQRAGEPGAAKVDAASIDNIIKALEALK